VAANEAAMGYSGTMVVCGTCTNATFKGLKNGGRYTFTVVPTTSAGAAKGLQSPVAVPASDLCPSGQACVAVDGAVPTGTANSNAQGFLHSIDQNTDSSRVAALRPRFWRGHGDKQFNDLVAPYGVEMTQIVSDYWVYYHWDKDKGGANPPWADWSAYSNYVTALVQLAKSQGWTPAYWEIQNEPDAGYPYVPGTDTSIENTLAVYQHGYEAIKAADPNAKVLGPSLSGFTITRVPAHPEILDLTTFLDFANAHNLRFDALGLHETGAEHLPQAFDRQPDSVESHVAQLRGELFRWPNIGTPRIFVSEYGGGRMLSVPGWRVGYIASIEAAGVESATTSCWPFAPVINCEAGTLGGLLDGDKSTPRAAYWVHRAYADMRGTRIDTSDSVQSLSAFAIAEPGGRAWRALLGRHQSCTAQVNPLCQQPASATPAPSPVTVAIRVGGPDRTLTATVARIPDVNGTVPTQPPGNVQQVVVRGGVGRLVLPAFADGDAYTLRIA
jgi:hypothetical protein